MMLGSTKAEVDRLLGTPLMAKNLLGLTHAGEKAYRYRQGSFDVVVGFLGGIARYMAVVRARGPQVPLSPSELSAALALNAPASEWVMEASPTPPKKTASSTSASKSSKSAVKGGRPVSSVYLSHIERDPKAKDRVLREMFGWASASSPYAFFHLPALSGQPPVLPDEWAVHQALG